MNAHCRRIKRSTTILNRPIKTEKASAANSTWTDRHATKPKAPSKSIAAPIALTTTMISMYELSVMNIPIPNMTSLPETTQKPPDTDITLGHTSFNLTVLAMVTILTILSLDLRRYGSIACQLQEQLIWLHGVYSMNSLNCLCIARYPPSMHRSLGPQDLNQEGR